MTNVRTWTDRYYTTVDAGDPDATADLFASDGCYRRGGYSPMTGDEIRRFYRSQRIIESGRHEIHTVLVNGKTSAVQGSFTGRLRDGRDVQIEFADFFEFDAEGLITLRTSYFFVAGV